MHFGDVSYALGQMLAAFRGGSGSAPSEYAPVGREGSIISCDLSLHGSEPGAKGRVVRGRETR